MSVDRFIDWGTFPEWGAPTIDRLAAVARDYLGERWTVALRQGRDLDLCWIDCASDEKCTFPLRSERDDAVEYGPNKGTKAGDVLHEAQQKTTRFFEVFFLVEGGKIEQTSVITRHCDEFTDNVADGLAKIYARWWNGKVRWPS